VTGETKPSANFSGTRQIRFASFVVDLDNQELFKNGARLRMPGQAFQVLTSLLARPGVVVTREELRNSLWSSDTFVDFEHGLNAAVNRLRDVLGDSAEKPRYIETLPRRGYRFIGEIVEAPPLDPVPMAAPQSQAAGFKANTQSDWRFIAAGIFCAGVFVAIAALGISSWRSRQASAPPLPSLSSSALPGEARAATRPLAALPFTSLPGLAQTPAFSPDGSRIAFAWSANSDPNAPRYDLYVKALGGEEKLQLTHHPSEWICSAWSPDGTRIAFQRMAGKDTGIFLVPAMGGPERKLTATRTPYDVAAPISWSPDGKWITFSNSRPNELGDRMFRVSVETSEVLPLEHDPGCVHEGNPIFSHDGQNLFYVCVHTMYDGELRSRPASGGAPTLIVSTVAPPVGLAVSGDDQRVAYSNGYGWPGVSFVNVKDSSITRLSVPEDSSWPTISPQGDKLAFSTHTSSISMWRRDLLHPSARPMVVIPSSRQQNSPQYSPDGKHIAFESKRDGDWAMWVSDVDGGNLLKLSKDIFGSGAPRWSPDGTRIAFDTAALNPSSIYVVDPVEAVPRKLQTQVPDMKLPAWSHDGKWIYFTSDSEGGHRIYRCSPQGGTAEQLPTDAHATRPEESADGQYLYVTSREVNFQLGKLSLKDPRSGVRPVPMPRVLHWTLWQTTPNGIYFVPEEARRTMRYFSFATGKVTDVFTLDKDFDDGFSVSPDGRYILYSQLDEVNADIMIMDKYH
jgi:Tol biopolymer transport system component/DNA-binding winged helix-turn-helix (wHTH) protein